MIGLRVLLNYALRQSIVVLDLYRDVERPV